MKIALITYSRTKNYGGILQSYALYEYLTKIGHEVEFIDYIPLRSNVYDKKKFVNYTTERSRLWGRNIVTKKLWSWLVYPKVCQDYRIFSDFIESKAHFTSRYYSYEELVKNPPGADIYMTGSDQVWSTQFSFNRMPDLPFFLGFANGKKISYASSFGREEISDENRNIMYPYLKKYDHISVREISGKKILAEMGIEAEVVLDPTLLVEPWEWECIVEKRPQKKDFILLYLIKFDRRLFHLAKELSLRYGVELVTVIINRNDKRKIRGRLVMSPQIQEWLAYVKYADVIVTDSFHAVIFSLIFRKKFFVNLLTRAEMSSRITNLLSIVNLSDFGRMDFDIKSVMELLDRTIDWNKVECLLANERKKSEQWLNSAIYN